MIDRVACTTALAKCLAFHACGKKFNARHWYLELLRLLAPIDDAVCEEDRE